MSDTLIPLDPNSEQAKHAVMALLGATLAELKQIDQNVVGSSTNIKGMKTDLKNVFNATAQPQPQPIIQPQAVPQPYIPPAATSVNAGLNIEHRSTIQLSPAVPEEDPNQLVFDFNKPITPNMVNDKLDRILDKLNHIIDLFKT